MRNNFTKTYIEIYFWEFLSVLLGLASLFLVIPYLSGNKIVYGIYSVCTSLTIYFSYADLGFLNAGKKYAAEYYAQNKLKDEIKIISFTTAVLLVFMICISLFILLLATNPKWLISDLNNIKDIIVCRQLLIILALSSPIIALQRILGIIFSIRLEDFKMQKIIIVANIIKISSVMFFFYNRYLLVEYYLFTQFINLFAVVYCGVIAFSKYKYNIRYFISNISFNTTIFKKVKGLAFSSLFIMICWILYYELDQITIAKLAGAEFVAIYAMSFSILTLFRTFFGIIYSPFTSRFNHFVGNKDFNGLNSFYNSIVIILLPLSVFPILIMSLLSKPFIISWVGYQYIDSADITSILVLCNIFASYSYPASAYLTALVKNKVLYISSAITVLIYWFGILFLFDHIGIMSYAIMKVTAFLLTAIYYYYVITKIMDIRRIELLLDIIKQYILPILICLILCLIIKPYMSYTKGQISLAINISFMGAIFCLSMISSLVTSKHLRNYFLKIISTLVK